MKKPNIVFWCWLWYLLAQCADMITSQPRWGGEELNPFFRDAQHHFVTSHALVGKTTMTLIIGTLSYLLYRLIEPLDRRVATILACVAPLCFGWMLWQVADDNLFILLRWWVK